MSIKLVIEEQIHARIYIPLATSHIQPTLIHTLNIRPARL